jgi:hypothetical protein
MAEGADFQASAQGQEENGVIAPVDRGPGRKGGLEQPAGLLGLEDPHVGVEFLGRPAGQAGGVEIGGQLGIEGAGMNPLVKPGEGLQVLLDGMVSQAVPVHAIYKSFDIFLAHRPGRAAETGVKLAPGGEGVLSLPLPRAATLLYEDQPGIESPGPGFEALASQLELPGGLVLVHDAEELGGEVEIGHDSSSYGGLNRMGS